MAKAVFSRKNGGKAIVFYVFVRKSGGTPGNFGGKNYFFIVLHKKPREIKLVFKRATQNLWQAWFLSCKTGFWDQCFC